MVNTTKPWYQSKTISFMALVMAMGGLDLVSAWIEAGQTDWRSIALVCTGVLGIALRLVTKEALA